MPSFIGQKTVNDGPKCAAHPYKDVAFPGDVCHICRQWGVSSRQTSLGIRWWIWFSVFVLLVFGFIAALAVFK